jgi:hypothetical protein
MSVRFTFLAVAAVGFVLLALCAHRTSLVSSAAAGANSVSNQQHLPGQGSTPVLVELFTSEGCSSCPPADAMLARLDKTQPVHGADIITLEEHVNYWDSLGWKDPFSSETATTRQTEYGEAFGGKEIYTPQMIVDGRTEFVGSSDGDALREIRAASQTPKTSIELSWQTGDLLTIHVEPLANAESKSDARAFLVITENRLHSDVKRGENGGRGLEHNGVARQFLPLGKIATPSSGSLFDVTIHPAREWNRENLRAVVFVQDQRSRHVLAAGAILFPPA